MNNYKITFTDGTTETVYGGWYKVDGSVIVFMVYDEAQLKYITEKVISIYPIQNIKSVHVKEGKDA